jgi:hypothetical protein
MEPNHTELQPEGELRHVMARLERVEKQNRILVRSGAALVLLFSIVLLTAQKPFTRIIEAQGFVLKDSTGKARAELHLTDSGPELILYGAQGRSASQTATAARLRVANDVPVLGLSSQEGPFATLNAGPEGPALGMYAGAGGNYELLRVGEDGPDVSLYTAKAHASLTVNNEGPGLSLAAIDGKSVAALSAKQEGPHLLLKDLDGFLAAIGSEPLVNTETGTKRHSSAANIYLVDPKGNILWSQP